MRWVTLKNGDIIEAEVPEINRFLAAIKAVCVEHGMSIAHEDSHGGFMITNYHEDTMQWLLDADDERDA